MTSSFLSYADDRLQFLHMCTYICVDWGLLESEARKRAVRGWKAVWVGKRENKAVDSMWHQEEGEQLEQEGDEQEEAGLGVRGSEVKVYKTNTCMKML